MDAVRKLVSRRLGAAEVGPHLDPELLAALAENSISPRDRASVFDHLSGCSECRNVLYLALPEAADVQQAFSMHRRQPRLALRWATLAASVIIIGGVVISNHGVFTEHSVSPPPVATNSIPQAAVSNGDLIARERTVPLIEPTQALAKVRPPAKHMTATPQAGLQFDQSGEVHFAAAPAVRETTPAAAQLDQMSSRAKPADSNGLLSSSATTVPAWRISSEGAPERSLDGGQSWQPVFIHDGMHFHAVYSLGREVWLGGEAGSLFHSADSGQTWEAVTLGPQVATAIESDIIRISFSDPQNGLVTTASGHIWSTSDGGKNWQLK